MKYRVVGWTDYDSYDVKDVDGPIGFAERNAIIDDIKAHGYLFSGWDHQEMLECVPILNDGKKRCYSQRGWGGVMAEAHGDMGEYDYAGYAFDFSLKREMCVYPDSSLYPEDFTPEKDLNEHFEIEVDEGIFELSQKQNPFFLDDTDTLRYIDKGDMLTLKCGEKHTEFLIDGIDRSRNDGQSNGSYTINTEFKIIVKHK